MINEDSPILDFYPSDFDIDMNGKKMAWQGVALLPFIEQHRLISALESKEDELNDDEKRRNRWGDNVMFISEGSQLYDPFCALYTKNAAAKVRYSKLICFRSLTLAACLYRYQTIPRDEWCGACRSELRPQLWLGLPAPFDPRMSRPRHQCFSIRPVLFPTTSTFASLDHPQRLSTRSSGALRV